MDTSGPHRRQAADVVAEFRSDFRRDLADSEVRSRLERYGNNELATETAIAAWRRFLAQFQDVLVILLLIATGISAGLWAYERDADLPYEAIAILAVVLPTRRWATCSKPGPRPRSRPCERCPRRTRRSFATENAAAFPLRRSCPATSS